MKLIPTIPKEFMNQANLATSNVACPFDYLNLPYGFDKELNFLSDGYIFSWVEFLTNNLTRTGKAKFIEWVSKYETYSLHST